ncbi:MAG: dTMP kinase [Candidatus Odinarchaeota archaeon]|nr:dTMP kinase [Candidatus Odinarchaeota archaeon]
MGLFITIEGIDGSGKTTFAKSLVDAIKRSELIKSPYYTGVVFGREPSDGFYGSRVRNILSGNIKATSWPWEKALLFALDRAEDVDTLIKPNLAKNKIVILDRYIHSQLAYQAAEGLDLNILISLNKEFPQPDIVFFLDIDPTSALERVKDRINKTYLGKLTLFERIDFLSEVSNNYKKFIERRLLAKHFVILDASNPTNILVDEALKIIRKTADDALKSKEA